jgi:hypothetical protein
MIKAKLDGIYSPELASGRGELPSEVTNCWVAMHADIGADNERGTDTFTFYVTTPRFLEDSLKSETVQLGRGLVIVNEFDWGVVESAVASICDSVRAESWEEAAVLLSRSFFYEFE